VQVGVVLEAGHPVETEQVDPVLQGLQDQELHGENTQEARESTFALMQVKTFVEDLIDKSYDSWKTTKYDEFQYKSNNILK
jgi:hypothetical protein